MKFVFTIVPVWNYSQTLILTVWIAIILWKDSDRNLYIYKVQLVPHTATLSVLKYDKIYP